MVGSSLGPYDILEPIGAGGMGEVYLALDTRLRRRVAIKVLPEGYASDPERLARFTLEARAAASLNHPHIAAIHDVGEAEGVHFMVQEYLQGSTLQEALADGALTVKRALRLGAEIAEAMAAAHAAGIVHRDLKPANIFIVEGDHAKILDFGLAKLMQQEAAPDDDNPKTPTDLGTVAGVIMGSAGYMAPEQVRGAEIDPRTDVFAFGAVLYEMACGARAFSGDTAVEALNAILNSDPTTLARINPTLPRDLVRIIDKCLAKDPARRYQSSGDLVVDLAALGDDVAGDSALSIGSFIQAEAKERPQVSKTRQSNWWPAVAGVVALAVAAAGYASRAGLLPGNTAAPAPVFRSRITVQEAQAFSQSAWTLPLAMSPDSTSLVYRAGEPPQLYLREFDAGDSRPILGTENGDSPFFSPDGAWLGFFESSASGSSARLRRIRLGTGEVETICECPGYDGGGVVWRRDDVIVFVTLANRELVSVPATGGVPTAVVQPVLEPGPAADAVGDPDAMHIPVSLVLLPDGDTLLGLIYEWDEDDVLIAVASKTGGGWQPLSRPGFLGPGAYGPLRYVASGHLVYYRPDGLVAVPFDAEGLQFQGNPTVVSDPVELPLSFGSPAFFTVSTSGSLVSTAPRPSGARSSLVWVDHQGEVTSLRNTVGDYEGDYEAPRLAADSTELAVNGGPYTWLFDLNRDTRTRLSDRRSPVTGQPVWARNGLEIVMTHGAGLAWMPTDFTGATRSVRTEGVMYPNDWAPDGSLALTRYLLEGWDILLMPFDENGEPLPPAPLVETAANEGSASFSLDGNWLAYASDESGQFEVYAQPFPGPGRRWTISTNGGASPAWSPDGRELYYRAGSAMMSVTVETASTLNPSGPRVVFDNPALLGATEGIVRNYDVAPDGERFVMVQNPGPWAPELNVVLNWFETLKTRVPPTR